MAQHLRRGADTSLGQAGWCDRCQHPVGDGVDRCLGTLPGVSHACCGHGDDAKAYVVLGGRPNQAMCEIPDAVTLTGAKALAYFASLALGPEHPDTVGDDEGPRLPNAWLRLTDSIVGKQRRCEVIVGDQAVAQLMIIGYSLENPSGNAWINGSNGTRDPEHAAPTLTIRLLAEPSQCVVSLQYAP
jgi:hypothetical protein